MRLGDAGTLYFTIPAKALATGDFRRAVAQILAVDPHSGRLLPEAASPSSQCLVFPWFPTLGQGAVLRSVRPDWPVY